MLRSQLELLLARKDIFLTNQDDDPPEVIEYSEFQVCY
jgi:hypothetical protein